MNTEPHGDDPSARAQSAAKSPIAVEGAGSPAHPTSPKIDTSALLGMSGVAAAMAEVTPKVDTSTLLSMSGVAAAFVGVYGDLHRVFMPDYVDATRRHFADLDLDREAVSEDLFVFLCCR